MANKKEKVYINVIDEMHWFKGIVKEHYEEVTLLGYNRSTLTYLVKDSSGEIKEVNRIWRKS